MEELREEVGVKERFRRKLVRIRLNWAGHVEQMERGWLVKRGCAQSRGKTKRITVIEMMHKEGGQAILTCLRSCFRCHRKRTACWHCNTCNKV